MWGFCVEYVREVINIRIKIILDNDEVIFVSEGDWGGNWTRIKLECLQEYMHMFTISLKNKPFSLYYIDAFAGTGEILSSNKNYDNGMFAELVDYLGSEEEIEKYFMGSAQLALETHPPFYSYIFIEQNRGNRSKLANLCERYNHRNIYILDGDCNDRLKRILETVPRNIRGIIFLDPFGMQVKWETLLAISKTKKFDIWYLFPTDGVNRCLRRDGDIPSSWESRLTKLFGDSNWRGTFYKPLMPEVNKQGSLFTDITEDYVNHSCQVKAVSNKDIEGFMRERLSTIFPYVCEQPIPLYNSRNKLLFSLFYCVSNDSIQAIRLGKKLSNVIIKKHLQKVRII